MQLAALLGGGVSTTPHVEFWTNESWWPRNTTRVVFLARIVHHLGCLMYGNGWTGFEPQTVVIHAISPKLSAETQRRDIEYACSLLLKRHLGYRQRAEALAEIGEPYPLPSPDEWALARVWTETIESETIASLDRFHGVVHVLTRVFEQGIVLTGLRPFEAGRLIPLAPGEWFNECFPAWFSTCQVHPENRYSRTPVRYGGLWLYVDVESYTAWLALAFDTVGATEKSASKCHAAEPNAAEESGSDAQHPDLSGETEQSKSAHHRRENDEGNAASANAPQPKSTSDVPQDVGGDAQPCGSSSAPIQSATADPRPENNRSNSVSEVTPRPKAVRKRGAREKYDWQAFNAEVVKRYKSGEIYRSVHAFADAMALWCQAAWRTEPSNSKLRERIAAILDQNGWTLAK